LAAALPSGEIRFHHRGHREARRNSREPSHAKAPRREGKAESQPRMNTDGHGFRAKPPRFSLCSSVSSVVKTAVGFPRPAASPCAGGIRAWLRTRRAWAVHCFRRRASAGAAARGAGRCRGTSAAGTGR